MTLCMVCPNSTASASCAVPVMWPIPCFATAIQLGLLPLVKNLLLNSDIHVTAITGSTGAGAEAVADQPLLVAQRPMCRSTSLSGISILPRSVRLSDRAGFVWLRYQFHTGARSFLARHFRMVMYMDSPVGLDGDQASLRRVLFRSFVYVCRRQGSRPEGCGQHQQVSGASRPHRRQT